MLRGVGSSGRRQVPNDAPSFPHRPFWLSTPPAGSLFSSGGVGAMKCGVFFAAKGPQTVICSRRYLLSYLSSISPPSPIRRTLRCLRTPSNDKQKTCVDKTTVPGNTHSSNSANTPVNSQEPRISGPHIYNNNDTNSLVKSTMPRIGVLPKNQKLFAELIHRPDLRATIFIPGNVGSLPNLLAIIRETERRYGPIAEYRCPTVVSSTVTSSLPAPLPSFFGTFSSLDEETVANSAKRQTRLWSHSLTLRFLSIWARHLFSAC